MPARAAGTVPEDLQDVHLLRADEVARLLKIGRSTVYLMCRRGQVPYIAINNSIRIPAAALRRWLEENTKVPKQE